MLKLGSKGSAPASDADVVKDGTDASLMADVVEASKSVAVIVDFHAEWCGPCKTLGPALEAAVRGAKGKAKLVKIDIEKNPQFAAQLRVLSIPAVFAFVNGRPVDGFMGAVPPSEIKAFVDRVAAEGGAGAAEAAGIAEALDAVDLMLAEGALPDAAETFGAVLGAEPANARALAGLIRALAAERRAGKAIAVLESAPAKTIADPALREGNKVSELIANVIVKGRVIAIEQGHATIDVGFNIKGRVELEEFANPSGLTEIKIGDEFNVAIRQVPNAHGRVIISRKLGSKPNQAIDWAFRL